MEKVNLAEKFRRIDQCWQPKIAGELNDSYVKLVRFEGAFVWHHHEHEDELFLIVKGTMRMMFRENGAEREIRVGAGEFVIVPRGVEHMPIAEDDVECVLLEPKSTLNTGNVRNERTVPELEWV